MRWIFLLDFKEVKPTSWTLMSMNFVICDKVYWTMIHNWDKHVGGLFVCFCLFVCLFFYLEDIRACAGVEPPSVAKKRIFKFLLRRINLCMYNVKSNRWRTDTYDDHVSDCERAWLSIINNNLSSLSKEPIRRDIIWIVVCGVGLNDQWYLILLRGEWSEQDNSFLFRE